MNADANIQVWLEMFSQIPPGIVVPYVQTSQDTMLHYKVLVVMEGHAGRSLISQTGEVRTKASIPSALGRVSVNRNPEDDCHINLVLSGHGGNELSYHFPCRDTTQHTKKQLTLSNK